MVSIVLIVLVVGAIGLFGSGVARGIGIVLVASALLLLAAGSMTGLALGAAGAAFWLAGHWFFAFKFHVWRSPLAQRVFNSRVLCRVDPTRTWGIRTFNDS